MKREIPKKPKGRSTPGSASMRVPLGAACLFHGEPSTTTKHKGDEMVYHPGHKSPRCVAGCPVYSDFF
jgi:hypothetical protein